MLWWQGSVEIVIFIPSLWKVMLAQFLRGPLAETGGSDGKESVYQGKRHRFDSCIRQIPWRRKWQPTPVFLPGKYHGWGPWQATWGLKESDTTEHVRTYTHTHTHTHTTSGIIMVPSCSLLLHCNWASSVVRSYRWQRKASSKNELII